MLDWWTESLERRAPKGGAVGLDGRRRRGGAFEPFLVPRLEMPQVDETDLPALLQWAAWNGIGTTEETVDPSRLRFRQRVDMAKVHAMAADVLAKPLLLDRDGTVLDGNHRAAAHKLAGTPAPAIVLDASFADAMALLFSFAGTYEYGDGQFHPVRN